MLSELHIYQFAIIEDIKIDFKPGFCVITGETGAGKSIIISAIGFIFGRTTGSIMIRKGGDKATVEAVFVCAKGTKSDILLKDNGFLPGDGNTYTIVRHLYANSRTSATINGKHAPVSVLRQLLGTTLDLMSQFAQLGLLNGETQLEYLDLYGGRDILNSKALYLGDLETWRAAQAERHRLESEISKANAQKDLLEFQIEELAQLELDEVDESLLIEESNRIRYGENLTKAGGLVLYALCEDAQASVLERLDEAVASLTDKPYLSEQFSDAISLIEQSGEMLRDAAGNIRNCLVGIEHDPVQLDKIESRLHALESAKKKYAPYLAKEKIVNEGEKPALEDLKIYLDMIKSKIDTVQTADDSLKILRAKEDGALDKAISSALNLSGLRKKTAAGFTAAICANLKFLNLKKTKINIAITSSPNPISSDLGEAGIDRVEILISLNEGEDMLSLSKIASGGELSRILLAIKVALNQIDYVPTVIFDEVDVGIGGKTAKCLGQMLSKLGQHHQMICITHLAQIAAYADHHIRIHKENIDSRTVTKVTQLHEADRIEEIARMLSGATDSAISRDHARELIDSAHC